MPICPIFPTDSVFASWELIFFSSWFENGFCATFVAWSDLCVHECSSFFTVHIVFESLVFKWCTNYSTIVFFSSFTSLCVRFALVILFSQGGSAHLLSCGLYDNCVQFSKIFKYPRPLHFGFNIKIIRWLYQFVIENILLEKQQSWTFVQNEKVSMVMIIFAPIINTLSNERTNKRMKDNKHSMV